MLTTILLRVGLFTGASFYYFSIAYVYGDVRISGGGKNGKLEFQDSNGVWGSICTNGFDDDAGDVACRQLGYLQASNVYTYSSRYIPDQ